MKLRLSVLALGLCLCLVLVARAEAQLNFSTGWGKRSEASQILKQDIEALARHILRLQSDLDIFLRYYRTIKQLEAQLLANPSVSGPVLGQGVPGLGPGPRHF